MAFTLLPIFVLSRLGYPIGQFGVPLLLVFIVLTIVIYWRVRPPFPWRLAFAFGLVLFLALLVIAYPMFKYGFDWVGLSTDDYANYILHANWLVHHGYFDLPSASDMFVNPYFSPFVWLLFPDEGQRTGAEMLLAWVMSFTGLSGLQAYMPVILSYHIGVISAAGALVSYSRRYRLAALLTCLLLSVAGLNTLGTMYQFLAQVLGVGMMLATATVVFRSFTRMRLAIAFRLGLLIAILTAALMITYPEITPFLGLPYIVYLILSTIRRRGNWKLSWQPMLASFGGGAVLLAVLLNTYIFDYVNFLLGQASFGADASNTVAGEYSFMLIPAGLSYLWGFQPIPLFLTNFMQSVAIAGGVVMLFLTLILMLRLLLRMQPVATVGFVMLLASIFFVARGVTYGSLKLAIYIQPVLIGSLVVGWLVFNRHRSRVWQIAPLLAFALLGLGSHFSYVSASYGLEYGRLTTIPYLSENRAFTTLERTLAGTEGGAVRSDATMVLAKMQSLFLPQRPTEFIPSQEYFGDISYNTPEALALLAETRSDYQIAGFQAITQLNYRQLHTFDLHTTDQPQTDAFYTNRPPAVESTPDPMLILTSPRQSAINGLHLDWFDDSIFITRSEAETSNFLVFAQSYLGQHYSYGKFASRERPELSNVMISAFQPEGDYFYPGSPMFATNRHLLFEVLNPSPTIRLRLEYTMSLKADGESILPPAEVIGDERLPLSWLGRGAAQTYSPPLVPQEIDGHYYVALDLGEDGVFVPKPRVGLMSLYGTDIKIDPRPILGYARDISVISEAEYASLNPPSSLAAFPADLANPDLEYSGIFEDGWLSEASFFCLSQPQADMSLRIQGFNPLIDDAAFTQDLTVLVDGQEVLQQTYPVGEIDITLPSSDAGRRCVELRFSQVQRLPNGDNRPIAAQLKFIGYQ